MTEATVSATAVTVEPSNEEPTTRLPGKAAGTRTVVLVVELFATVTKVFPVV